MTTGRKPQEDGPGGRHDNDFNDIRKISILPTADELASDNPFLPRAIEIEERLKGPEGLAFHTDGQFRLLREDMLRDLREEIQIALMIKKGRRKGFCVENLSLTDIHSDGLHPWSLKLQCLQDIPQLRGKTESARKKFLQENVKFLKHESLACLVVDGDVITLGMLIRDDDLLAKRPPVLCLQIPDAVVEKTLRRLKTADNIKLVQLSTALFSYEPILRQLKQIKELSLEEEILRWEKGRTLNSPNYNVAPDLANLITDIEEGGTPDLKDVLRLPSQTKLDQSQFACFLAGLRQRVCLIQGPPGTYNKLACFKGYMKNQLLSGHRNRQVVHRVTYRQNHL
jgi:hypothetical protein